MNVSLWLKSASQSVNLLDAELILAHFLGAERTFLHAHPDSELSEEIAQKANLALERRQKHEPLAYITGVKDFYGRQFIVTPDVLIPRPETEVLIEIAKGFKPTKILDVGTGSGCIAITLAKELPNAQITGVDISEKALKIAQNNAQKYHAKVNFRQSDLLNGLENTEKFDLIIANLPYVDRDWGWLGLELQFEPKTALFAEDGGLELIKKLIQQAPEHLEQGGCLLLEADKTQHQKIVDFAVKTGNFTPVNSTLGVENSALALVLQLR
ncbi:peptide chain release factor N(5)-glutamine methyltransferase [Candidatus Saccharibacteria bacterium]|nr:peptide chain release factor N(5)-glutamine methyltransferase [Candidatus Saccharibacteria bacterium]